MPACGFNTKRGQNYDCSCVSQFLPNGTGCFLHNFLLILRHSVSMVVSSIPYFFTCLEALKSPTESRHLLAVTKYSCLLRLGLQKTYCAAGETLRVYIDCLILLWVVMFLMQIKLYSTFFLNLLGCQHRFVPIPVLFTIIKQQLMV